MSAVLSNNKYALSSLVSCEAADELSIKYETLWRDDKIVGNVVLSNTLEYPFIYL